MTWNAIVVARRSGSWMATVAATILCLLTGCKAPPAPQPPEPPATLHGRATSALMRAAETLNGASALDGDAMANALDVAIRHAEESRDLLERLRGKETDPAVRLALDIDMRHASEIQWEVKQRKKFADTKDPPGPEIEEHWEDLLAQGSRWAKDEHFYCTPGSISLLALYGRAMAAMSSLYAGRWKQYQIALNGARKVVNDNLSSGMPECEEIGEEQGLLLSAGGDAYRSAFGARERAPDWTAIERPCAAVRERSHWKPFHANAAISVLSQCDEWLAYREQVESTGFPSGDAGPSTGE